MDYYRENSLKKKIFEGHFVSYLKNNVLDISKHDILDFFLLTRYDISCLVEMEKRR